MSSNRETKKSISWSFTALSSCRYVMGERLPTALRRWLAMTFLELNYLQVGSRSKVCQNLCKGEDCVPNELEETDSSNYNSDRSIHVV